MTNPAEPSLVQKVLDLHDALDEASIRHAFGGALALAYWTAEPRATADIDVNISIDAEHADIVFAALPAGIHVSEEGRQRVREHEQVRLWWGRTPVDLFFRASDFHDGLALRSIDRPFAGVSLPFVEANDLAVLKSLFDRPKDWVDIAAMVDAGSIDVAVVADRIAAIVGGDDDRLQRLAELVAH